MIRRILVLGAVALAMLVFAPAAHAQYPPGTPGASVSDSTVSSGDTVTVTATGCDVGSTVTFYLNGATLGSAVADADGAASADVVITGSPGTYQISNSCNSAVIDITITGAGVTPGNLARTGTDSSLPLAKIAIVLIAAGGLLVVAARDRSKKSVSA
ncbi:MAG: hypothetical protein KDB35_23325 [Acidimicrobiales bacterium]|nr:hypothetical protein [Acidimicrobiales bacterium]